MEKFLLPIPAKRYFTIGEVGDLCGVKPHVLRYWEQEFKQLRPMKRRGNRRYYQHHEVLVIRKIRELLYDQGFTIVGARNKLDELAQSQTCKPFDEEIDLKGATTPSASAFTHHVSGVSSAGEQMTIEINDDPNTAAPPHGLQRVRRELLEIRDLLKVA